MARAPAARVQLTVPAARRLWLHAQRLDAEEPFGEGPAATAAAVAHLGYVQIDTIHVVERCHHHILWSRIPAYRRSDLHAAQSIERTVFEYWTHALAYVPTADFRFFVAAMRRRREDPDHWFGSVEPRELSRLLARIRRDGPLSIRDIDDEVRVEKTHPWASRKPAKKVLQHGFYAGLLTISERRGMVKTYELTARHFGWDRRPRAAGEADVTAYLLDRALRAQGLVSLDSVCHLDAGRKAAVRALIEARVKGKRLLPVVVDGLEKVEYWAEPEALATIPGEPAPFTHILSPFDPLIIQRKRLSALFGYDHLFEAYMPKEKRRLGYFALPVLVGERIAAAIDIKTDRANRRLLIRQWTWVDGPPDPADRPRIEEALHRFERFQLGLDEADYSSGSVVNISG